MGRIAAAFRLLAAARVMAKHDVLLPDEIKAQAPWPARVGAGLLRLTTWRRGTDAPTGARFAKALGELGPSYVKLGQFLATRPDIVGRALADDLAALQDKMAPFPSAQAKAEIAAAFGKPVEAIFETFSEPVAAASIAQVHRARIKGADGDVAVKALRPGVEARFRADLESFYLAARTAERVSAEARRLRAVAFVDTLAESVRLEMDLRLEGAAAAEMAENAKGDPGFRVPKTNWELSAKRVLVTEWVEGLSLRDHAGLDAAGIDRKRLADTVIRSFLTHALRDGFFHADMHQGNLFAAPNGDLIAVDFGIMGRIDPVMRRFMAETLYGFLNRDYARVAQIHFDVAFVPPDRSVDAFAQALRSVGERVFGRPAREISMAALLGQLFEITETFGMRMQPQLVLLQKTMVVVEGVARDLDPDHNIWDAARPVVERFMTETLSPPARLREAAESFGELGRLVQDAVTQGARVAAHLAEGGIKLHPETAARIAEEEAKRDWPLRLGVWVGAIALVALAIGQI